MDPYNQYQYQYTQNTPGPPQPQWQASPRRQGWGDPRPDQQQYLQSPVSPYESHNYTHPPPPPPPPPPPATGAPPQQYPYAAALQPQHDTSLWGVKYNQGGQVQPAGFETRPPLPPRPTSAAPPNQSPRPDQAQWQRPTTPIGLPSTPQQHQSAWHDPYQYHQPAQSSAVPPPPPPRPPEYQNQVQLGQIQYQQSTLPHEHYSHHQPSHNYDPHPSYSRVPNQFTDYAPQQPPAYNYTDHQQPTLQTQETNHSVAPVSPLEHDRMSWPSYQISNLQYGDGNVPGYVPPIHDNNNPLSATALGPGRPSDWEHFGDVPHTTADPVSPQQAPAKTANAKTDTFDRRTSSPLPQTTAPTIQTPPLASRNNNEPFTPSVQSHGGATPSRRKDSDTSTFSFEGPRRTGTIDSVINAWSSPLKQSEKHPIEEEEEAQEPRPASRTSERAPIQERVVEVMKVVDPYEDLEPEYKASLKRFAGMLRKESVAATDEEKFRVFETFVSKELRLRSMLYDVDYRPPASEPSVQSRHNAEQVAVLATVLATDAKSSQLADPGAVQPTNTTSTTETEHIPPALPKEHDLDQLGLPVPSARSPLPPNNETDMQEDLARSTMVPLPAVIDTAVPPQLSHKQKLSSSSLQSDVPAQQSDVPIQDNPLSAQNKDTSDMRPIEPNSTTTTAKPAMTLYTQVSTPMADTLTKNEEIATTAPTAGHEAKHPPMERDPDPFQPPVAPRTLPSLDTKAVAHRKSSDAKDDSFVFVNHDNDEVEYSPGGRPRIPKLRPLTTSGSNFVAPASSQAPKAVKPTQKSIKDAAQSPSNDAPIVLEDYIMAAPPSPGRNAPIVLEGDLITEDSRLDTPFSEPQIVPGVPSVPTSATIPSVQSPTNWPHSEAAIKFEPDRPAYMPYRYNPATTETLQQPADQSYSALRRDAVESGRLLTGHESSSPAATPDLTIMSPTGTTRLSPAVDKKPHDEAFIGLIRQQSKAIRKTSSDSFPTLPQLRPGTPRAAAPDPHQILSVAPPMPQSSQNKSMRQNNELGPAVLALRTLLPATVPNTNTTLPTAFSAPQAMNFKSQLDAIPDNFSFIHETVMAWDRQNREVRKMLDEERHARQTESEQRIDDLFNDNEIGYADIGDLEAEFKLAEARKRYEEDKSELESFSKNVFTIVTSRLEKEIKNLDKLEKEMVQRLNDDSEPVSFFLRADSSSASGKATAKFEMAALMTLILSTFNKLEIRHQKVAEAQFERERRRKRLEVSVLYTNGDTRGMKKLEADFSTAEKLQIVQACKAKDDRANKLMDTFDRATVRGLGDNQTFVDELVIEIKTLKDIILARPPGDPSTATSNIPEDVYTSNGARDTLGLAQEALNAVLGDSQRILTTSNIADQILNEADYAVSVASARAADADKATYTKLEGEKAREDAKIVEDTQTRMNSVAKGPEETIALIREVVDRVGDDKEHQERIAKALEKAKRRANTMDSS